MEWTDGRIYGVEIRKLEKCCDARGWLAEVWRDDGPTLTSPLMAYVSFTWEGVTRGPHEHREQTDFFVFLGRFKLMLWDARVSSPTCGMRWFAELGGDGISVAVVPPGVVHAYTALDDGMVLNMPDKLYAGWGKAGPVDEIRHENDPDSQYDTKGEQI